MHQPLGTKMKTQKQNIRYANKDIKMTKTLFTLLSIIVSILLFSCSDDSPTEVEKDKEQVITGDVILSSQADVDSFTGTSILGSLYITGEDITNLDGLSSLTSIRDIFEVSGNALLTNLNGLRNITSVRYFSIISNSALTNLDGLSNITSATSLQVSANKALMNIDGLINLTSVDDLLQITGTDFLTNLDGLGNLASVDAIYIFLNSALTNLDGMSSLTSLKFIWIDDNKVLKSFCGLYPRLSSGVLADRYYSVSGNMVNPSQQQIIDDGPCTQ